MRSEIADFEVSFTKIRYCKHSSIHFLSKLTCRAYNISQGGFSCLFDCLLSVLLHTKPRLTVTRYICTHSSNFSSKCSLYNIDRFLQEIVWNNFIDFYYNPSLLSMLKQKLIWRLYFLKINWWISNLFKISHTISICVHSTVGQK